MRDPRRSERQEETVENQIKKQGGQLVALLGSPGQGSEENEEFVRANKVIEELIAQREKIDKELSDL